MASVRRQDGFVRYAFAVSYHGGSSLGFSYQSHENALLSDGTDLRGLYSIEGRIRRALSALVGDTSAVQPISPNNDIITDNKMKEYNFENFQVSSRTDRGVHALKNIRPRRFDDRAWAPHNLLRGINFHLVRQSKDDMMHYFYERHREYPSKHILLPHNPEHDVRILSCRMANHLVRNHHPMCGRNENQPEQIDWNARFTASSRTYCYRILHMVQPHTHDGGTDTTDEDTSQSSCEDEYIIPFEAGRSWLVRGSKPLNIEHMQHVSTVFLGKHDFSSFRAKGCERSTPIVQINHIQITSEPMNYPFWISSTSTFHSMLSTTFPRNNSSMNMVTIMIQGESFLYRQVRNMVGCLLKVGQEKLSLEDVQYILEARDRRKAPSMAPSHGLFLVDVKHNWY